MYCTLEEPAEHSVTRVSLAHLNRRALAPGGEATSVQVVAAYAECTVNNHTQSASHGLQRRCGTMPRGAPTSYPLMSQQNFTGVGFVKGFRLDRRQLKRSRLCACAPPNVCGFCGHMVAAVGHCSELHLRGQPGSRTSRPSPPTPKTENSVYVAMMPSGSLRRFQGCCAC